MIAGRRFVRSLMNLPSVRRALRRTVSKSVPPCCGGLFHRAPDGVARFVEQRLGLGRVDPTLRDDLRPADDLAGPAVDGHEDHDDALFGELAPVAQHALADVAHDAVDVGVPGGYRLALDIDVPIADGHLVAVLADEHVLGLDPCRERELRVVDHVAELAVHRDHVLRLHEVEQDLELLLRRVPRHVDRGVAVVHHLRSGPVERVDHAIDVALVAGNGVRRDHDDVVLTDLHVLVLVGGHERECAHGLALGARADDADLTGRVVRRLLDVDHAVGRDVDEAHLAGQAHVLDHRSTDERHTPARPDRGLRDLLHPVEVRREARDDDPLALVVPEQRTERRADGGFRGGEARAFGIRAVRQQHQHPTGPARDLTEASEVRTPPVDRREVDLEVAAVQDRALRRVVRRRERVRHRVGDRDELDVEGADLSALAVADRNQLGAVEQPRLLDAGAGQAERERRAVDREGDVAQQEGDAAGVVLVTVGQDQADHRVRPLAQIGEVREDEVDARHVGLREHDPAVDEQDPPLDLEREAIATDLTETAEKGDAYRVRHCRRLSAATTGRRADGPTGRRRVARFSGPARPRPACR